MTARKYRINAEQRFYKQASRRRETHEPACMHLSISVHAIQRMETLHPNILIAPAILLLDTGVTIAHSVPPWQEYCGCSYSLRDSNHWRAKQGQPPIVIGGESYYSDAAIDEQEESLEVVESFFQNSASFEEELKQTYATRRKNAKRADKDVNNW